MSDNLWSEGAWLRPDFIEDETWDKIYSNFRSGFNSPFSDLPTYVQTDLNRLQSIGISNPSDYLAVKFDIDQAGDFGSLAERGNVGSLGQGWASLADIKLVSTESGVKTITGLLNTGALQSLSLSGAAEYTLSSPLSIHLSDAGLRSNSSTLSRPIYTISSSQSGNTKLEISGNEYHVHIDGGELLKFGQEGNLISYMSSSGRVVTASYDLDGNLEKFEDQDGNTLEFTYDANGDLTTAEDKNGNITTYTYDTNGRLEETDVNGVLTNFTYDSEGNLLTSQRDDGAEQAFTYNSEGKLSSSSNGGTTTNTYTYDDAGAITITNSLNEETTLQFGPGGYLASATNDLGETYTYTPDADANTVTITSPDSVDTIIQYNSEGLIDCVTDGNGSIIYWNYDDDGRLLSFTDANGNERTFDYEPSGLLDSVTWDDNTYLDYNYNSNGDLIEYINRRGDSVDYTYNASGETTSVSDSASGALTYTYDINGNVASVTSSQGTTDITYDSFDRVTLIEYPDGRSLAYTYDDDGKRLSMVNQDNDGTFYTYDSADRLETVSDDNGVLVTYTYNSAGQLSTEVNGNGTYTDYGYDSTGRITSITNYDSNSNVNSYFSYTYNLAGYKATSTSGDGTWTYSYDDIGQLTEADFVSTNASVSNKSLEYQYDDAGNRTAVIEDGTTTYYASNNLNQYTSVGGKTLTYDDDGNLITTVEGNDTYEYEYDIDNRITEITKPDGTIISYEYDAFGNRSAIVEDGVRTEFLIDPFGYGDIVSEYDGSGNKTAGYTYGLGLTSVVDGSGNVAFYDFDAAGSVTSITDNLGVIANSYVYTPFGDELFESETILNDFEFNGALGITEDLDDMLYMRARNYDVELGRFLSEDPLFVSGDPENLYRFALNNPVEYIDPAGTNPFVAGFIIGQLYHFATEMGEITRQTHKFNKQIIDNEAILEHLGQLGQAGAELPTNPYSKDPSKLNKVDPRAGEEGGDPEGGQGGSGDGGGPNLPSPPPEGQGSPLVLDLDGNGIELYSKGTYGTYFDLLGTGQAVLTGWVEDDDGLLAIDLNEDGEINDISELFGSKSTDGFSELSAYDDNEDGVIDFQDAVFEDLIIWQDINSDGVAQENEMFSLSDFSIESISLDTTLLADTEINGNLITHESTYTLSDGTIREIVDAWFTYDISQTKNNESYDLDIRTLFLPTLKGFGDLKNLHIAMSLDNGTEPESLISQVIDITTTLTLEDAFADTTSINTTIEDILLKWAGVESIDPSSRGSYVDAQHLAFYEELTGREFVQYDQNKPLPEAGVFVEAVFDYLVSYYKTEIITQIVGAEIFENAKYSPSNATIEGDLALTQDGIDQIEALALDANTDAAEVWTNFAQFIGYSKGLDNLTSAEITALDTAVAVSGGASLSDWSDVVSLMTVSLGAIIESSDDWGSFEIYYDNNNIGDNLDNYLLEDNANGYTNNEFQGKGGNDTIEALDGHDKLSGGDGNDILDGGTGDDYMLGGDGDDTYLYESGNDTISEEGGSGYDELVFKASTGITESNIVDMFRNEDNLILRLDTGYLISIHGYNGLNTKIEKIVFEYDSSEIDLTTLLEEKFIGSDGIDEIIATGSSAQTLSVYGYESNDRLTVDGSAGKIYGGDGYDVLQGDHLSDSLYGEGQDDYLLGNDGDDYLEGGTGADWLDGGAGNDTLKGDSSSTQHGADVYLFGRGDGQDFISKVPNTDPRYFDQSEDKILFDSDVLTSDITLYRGASASLRNDITFQINGTADSITVEDAYDKNNYWIHKFGFYEFGDGTVWDHDDVYSEYISQNTTSGNDSLTGFDGEDVYLASLGNDYIAGYDGDDIYYWETGHGNDIIYDYEISSINNYGAGDKLILSGYDISDLNFAQSGNDLILTDMNSNETLTIEDFYRTYGSKRSWAIETFEFDDGSNMSISAIEDMAILNHITMLGTQSNDNITAAASYNDVIYVGDGDDIVDSDDGDDSINGESGADTLLGGTGNDDLNGEAGDDKLYGDLGADTLKGEEGQDSIYGGDGDDFLFGGTDEDYLEGGDNNDVLYGGDGDDKSIWDTQGNKTFNGGLYGGAGNDTLYGDDGSDRLDGEDGDDNIYSGTGDDSAHGGNGDDVIYGGSGDDLIFTDYQIETAATGHDTAYGDEGNDLIYGGAGNDEIHGGNDNDSLSGGADDDIIYGDAGIDIIYGDYESSLAAGGLDTLHGGDGADSIYGGLANDLIYGDADDDLIYGQAHDDTIYGGAGNDLIYTDYKNPNIDDGNDIAYGEAGNDTLLGRDGHDTLEGGADDDKLYGGDGNDTLRGDDGLDLLYGNDGNDYIYGGLNKDYAEGGNGEDVIDLGDGNDTASGGSGDDTLYAGDGADKLLGLADADLLYGGSGGDQIYGDGGVEKVDDGNDIIYGEDGNDLLYGLGGADILFGGADNDKLYGNSGDDILHGGAGADSLVGGDGNDVLIFGDGIDQLWGQGGADILEAIDNLTGRAVVYDWDSTEDALDITEILDVTYDPLNDAIADFVDIQNVGSNTKIYVSENGDGTNWTEVLQVQGQTLSTDEQQWIDDNNLLL